MGKGDIFSNSTTILVLGVGVLFLAYKSDLFGKLGSGASVAIEKTGDISTGLGMSLAGLGMGVAEIGAGVNNIGRGFQSLGDGLGVGFAYLGQGLGSGISKIGDIGTGLGMGIQFMGAGGGNLLTDLSVPRILNALYGKEVSPAFNNTSISKLGGDNFINTMNVQRPVDVVSAAKTSSPSWATSTNPFVSSGTSSGGGGGTSKPQPTTYMIVNPTSPTGYSDKIGQPMSPALPSWAQSKPLFIKK